MYESVGRSEIIERIRHIRDLHRQSSPINEQEQASYAKREQKTKDLLSNFRRTNVNPTLSVLREFGELNSLTVDGGHQLFGYQPDAIREFNLLLNGGRTHIVESYVFSRDQPVDLPKELASAERFTKNVFLPDLVNGWHSRLPIRSVERSGWRKPGTFYVHVGTDDSLGSSIPPGALAAVHPIDRQEAEQPNPRAHYLLQFRNGYRCSRCVVTRGRLQLLSGGRGNLNTELFAYPLTVRIAGRIQMFAMDLPVAHQAQQRSLSSYRGDADLILPWEHPSRHDLFATEHKRFRRDPAELKRVTEMIQSRLVSNPSERTRRRYRYETISEPHVDTLIHMSLEHFVRYTDALRVSGFAMRDRNRFSLDKFLNAQNFSELKAARQKKAMPPPGPIWDDRRREFGEWPALLSLKFPNLKDAGDSVVRVAYKNVFPGLEPSIEAGSVAVLRNVLSPPLANDGAILFGWERPIYLWKSNRDNLLGHLVTDANTHLLMSGGPDSITVNLTETDLSKLRLVCGVAVPV